MNAYPFLGKKSFTYGVVIKLTLSIFLTITSGLLAEPQQSDHVKAQIISEVRSIQPGQSFCVALCLKMDEHWHTYWKNPGDSGLATKIEWDLPEGFVSGDIQWPYPKKFETPPLVSFGYDREVFLITEIKAPKKIKSGTKVKLRASVDWLACRESCIAGHADLTIDLPIKNGKPKINARWAGHFEKTRRMLPETSFDWEINASLKEEKILIQAIPPSSFKSKLNDIIFFPEQIGLIDHSKSQNLIRSKNGYIIEVQRSLLLKKIPARFKGVLFSKEGWSNSRDIRALHIDVPLYRH